MAKAYQDIDFLKNLVDPDYILHNELPMEALVPPITLWISAQVNLILHRSVVHNLTGNESIDALENTAKTLGQIRGYLHAANGEILLVSTRVPQEVAEIYMVARQLLPLRPDSRLSVDFRTSTDILEEEVKGMLLKLDDRIERAELTRRWGKRKTVFGKAPFDNLKPDV